jgi:hypothetical protein
MKRKMPASTAATGRAGEAPAEAVPDDEAESDADWTVAGVVAGWAPEGACPVNVCDDEVDPAV